MLSIRRIRLAIPAILAATVTLALALPAFASAANFSLTINIEPEGSGTVECEVGEAVEECAAEYEEGTEVNLVPEAEEGFEFSEFGGSCGPLSCELVMEDNYEVDAFFEVEPGTLFELNLETAGSGFGEIACEVEGGEAEECDPEYLAGTELALVAEAEEGSEFAEWEGDCTGETCELTMDEAHEVAAVFNAVEIEYPLEIETAGGGSGTVTCEAEEGPGECQAEYPAGTEVTLTAEAEAGSEFAGFSGDCEGEECTVTMDEARSVTVVFNAEPHSLTISVSGEGEVECKVEGGEAEACEAEYADGTELTLVASPEAGWEFEGWEGGTGSAEGCTGASPCTFTLEENSEIEASFVEVELRILTINVEGEGEVECKVEGGEAEACEAVYPEGTELTLVANPEAGWEFVGFANGEGSAAGCTGTSPCTFTLEADSEVDAFFEEMELLSLTINVSGSGTVECEVEGGEAEACEAEYEEGTELTLVANPEAGWEFTGWEGGTGSAAGCEGTSPCTFTLEEGSEVEAVFVEEPPVEFSLTISTAGTGSGSVTCNGGACAAKYAKGAEVTLAAAPAAGSTFAGWSGGGCSGTGNCVVTMTADTTVTATFNAEPAPEPTPEPEPEPEPEPAGRAKVVKRVVLVRGGRALLKLRCVGGPCKGRVKLVARVKKGSKKRNLVIGKRSFRLAKGKRKIFKVKLTAPAKQELKRRKTLRAKVKGSGIVRTTIKLKLRR